MIIQRFVIFISLREAKRLQPRGACAYGHSILMKLVLAFHITPPPPWTMLDVIHKRFGRFPCGNHPNGHH